MTAFIHATGISSRVFFSQHLDIQAYGGSFRSFRLDDTIQYWPYCDDFGPMNLACVVHFIRSIDAELASFPTNNIIWCIDDGKRSLTNAVFLLGAYMILKQEKPASEAADRFSWIASDMLEPYRDATHSIADFHLQLIDCWRGLEKGVQHGWVRFAASHYMWGAVDIDEYAHYDNPANGNLHEVVPGKLVALKDPMDLGAADYRDGVGGMRDFSPSYYAAVLAGMGVSTVVQLGAPRYAADAFTSRGFAHFCLDFGPSACPPDAVVAAFFQAMDAAPGAVAVHCPTGLGRTGTLAALHLMRSHGFTAREAMGWLRIMRPGSVCGEQQHYLCAVQAATEARLRPSPSAGRGTAAAAAASAGRDRPAAKDDGEACGETLSPAAPL